jgi:pilus assembly protein CpaC
MSLLLKRLSLAAALAGGVATFNTVPASAQTIQTQVLGGPGQIIRLDTGASQVQDVTLSRGKSVPVNFNGSVRNTAVSDPAVVDLLPMSPGQFILTAKAPGHTDIRFFDGAGKPILTMNIRVEMDTASIASTIARVVPKAQVQVEAIDQSIVLTGHADTISDADAAVQIARLAVAKPENVLNRITLSDKDQVMLKVRIVEVQRNVIKQLGFDLNALIGQIGGAQFNFANAATFAVNNGLQGGLSGGYKLDTTQQPVLTVPCAIGLSGTCTQIIKDGRLPDGTLVSNGRTATAATTVGSDHLNQAASTIKAFERNGLIRTLAEPDLTAVSGEAAKFLAGGEFPVPVGSDVSGRTSIDFKPFGVGLGFTPIVLSSGRISLKISTEVSELSSLGAFNLTSQSSSSSSGGTTTSVAGPTITVPGLNVRRAETTVELPSGGAMMIAGLLKEETKQDLDSLPGLMNLPVLGALFRSRDYQAGETELVIIVTPYLVNPTSPANLQTPADGLQIANDAETILLGRLNKVYKAPPAAVAGRTYQGPVGYVIE